MRHAICCLIGLIITQSVLAAPVSVSPPPVARTPGYPPPGSPGSIPGVMPAMPAGPTGAVTGQPDNTPIAMPAANELAKAVSVGQGKHKLGYDGRARALYLAKEAPQDQATDANGAKHAAGAGGPPGTATGLPIKPQASNGFYTYPVQKSVAPVQPQPSSEAAQQAPAMRSDSSLSGDMATMSKPSNSPGSTSGASATPTQPTTNLPLLPTTQY